MHHPFSFTLEEPLYFGLGAEEAGGMVRLVFFDTERFVHECHRGAGVEFGEGILECDYLGGEAADVVLEGGVEGEEVGVGGG